LLKEKGLVDKIENSIQSDAIQNKFVDRERIEELIKIQKDYFKKVGELKFITSYMKIQSILKTLEDQKLPTSITNFSKNPVAEILVKDKFQNINLDSKINLLSNEHIFNNLYINERSSTQAFLEILKDFGIDLNEENNSIDAFTIDSVISSRLKNVLSKAGIGVTANINKTLAFLSQYKIEGIRTVNEPVFRFRSGPGELIKTYGDIGGFSVEGIRTIGIIGNILGMFTDGAKEPIPAALNLNEINTPITLAMIALGIDRRLALAYNFIPEIKTAIENVQKSTYAVNDGLQNSRKYLVNELNRMIRTLQHDKAFDKDYKIINELRAAGLIGDKDNVNNMSGLSGSNLIISYDKKEFDKELLLNNKLSLSDIGITVSALKVLEVIDENENVTNEQVEIELSEKAQKLVLLYLYKEQAKQNSVITSAGNIVNMFKRLRPDFEFLDKMIKDVSELKSGLSLVPKEIADSIFSDDQVWTVFERMLTHMNEKSKTMFIERSDHFKNIKNTFEHLFKSKDLFAKTITSFIALNKYKQTFAQNDPSYSQLTEEQKAKKDEETAMIMEMFTADYWFDNNLEEELTLMQEKYPDNAFLNRLRTFTTNNQALIKGETEEENELVNEKIITLIGNAKLTGRFLENVENDAHGLFFQEPMFFKRLLIHEFVRTGLMQKSGSYMPYINPDFKLGISKHLNDFEDILRNTSGVTNLVDKLKNYLNYTSNDEVYTFFETMLANLVYSASDEIDNNKIRTIASEERPIDVSKTNGFNKIDVSDLNDPDKDPVEELINYVLPMPGSAQFNGEELYIADEVFNDETEEYTKLENIIFNFNTPNASYGNISQNNMIDIANAFDVSYDTNTKSFVFPSAIKVGKSYYILKGVDSEINKPLGSNLIAAEKLVSSKEDFISTYNTGKLALYKRLVDKPVGSSISTLGFSTEELSRYANLTLESPTEFLNVEPSTSKTKKLNYSVDKIVNRSSGNLSALQYNIIYPSDPKAELLKKLNELQKLHNEGTALYTMRVSKKQAKYFKGLDEQHHYGNPFTGTKVKGQIPMNGITAAVNAYEDWLNGQDYFTDKNGVEYDLYSTEDSEGVSYKERRDWILGRIEKLSAKPEIIKLGYFLSGYRSHADVLDNLINKGKREKASLDSSKINTPVTSSATINIYAGTKENAELSNFAIRPFTHLDIKFDSVEQAFQFYKTEFSPKNENNAAVASVIKDTTDGKRLRELGREFKGLDQKVWDSMSASIMKVLLKDSFEQNPDALAKLLATGNATLTHTQDKTKWGKEFPKLLMEVRSELGNAAPNQSATQPIESAAPVVDEKRPVFNMLPSKSATKTMTYAGIGSRETPQAVLDQMTEASKYLDSIGYTLQTGFTYKDKVTGLDEEGADKAFSDGTQNKILFGPSGIRKTVKGATTLEKYDESVTEKSNAIVEEIHPAPERLTPGAIKLMARNTNQIFGQDLNSAVDFILFYAQETPGSIRPKGGTGQAVEMARRKGIPTINMADTDWKNQLQAIIGNKTPVQPTVKTVAERNISYTPKGKETQTYTIKGSKIFNKTGDEVFKTDSVDRNKIFANLAVKEGRAVVVNYKKLEDSKAEQFIVNDKDVIVSATTGKIMNWSENDGKRLSIINLAQNKFSSKGKVSETQPVAKENLSYKDDAKKPLEQLTMQFEENEEGSINVENEVPSMTLKSKYFGRKKDQNNLPEIPDTTDC
jgi:predicted NAD-dependent protein-ADP-ribosyltransferase YbiA (DUF1768 family)